MFTNNCSSSLCLSSLEPLQKRVRVSVQDVEVTPPTKVSKKATKRPKQGGKGTKTAKKSTKTPKKMSKPSQQKGKTVTPPKEPGNALSLSEIRHIKSLIEISINPNDTSQPTPLYPQTRCEEIHALIEEMVAKGAEIRKNANSQNDHEEWFHPQMQKCIRLQVCYTRSFFMVKFCTQSSQN